MSSSSPILRRVPSFPSLSRSSLHLHPTSASIPSFPSPHPPLARPAALASRTRAMDIAFLWLRVRRAAAACTVCFAMLGSVVAMWRDAGASRLFQRWRDPAFELRKTTRRPGEQAHFSQSARAHALQPAKNVNDARSPLRRHVHAAPTALPNFALTDVSVLAPLFLP
ncbi:hypothetical protein B0H11DRAFT_370013 [Mycena galericulata]|nr:hypothetical protein B0H11DRAFT_370013 [Mycena galericulata]